MSEAVKTAKCTPQRQNASESSANQAGRKTTDKKTRLGIIFGGRSGEHEVSLLSAASVIRATDKEKYELAYVGITKNGEWKLLKPKQNAAESEERQNIAACLNTAECMAQMIEDGSWENEALPFNPGEIKTVMDFALPVMHGPYCEDGKIQGLFEMLDIPYGGCGVLASAVAMDKLLAKDVFARNGLPICEYAAVTKSEYESEREEVLDRVGDKLGYPNFVKPANMGSSVGVSKASDRSSLAEALDLAFRYDKRVIVEEYINCRELETAILGNASPEAAVVGEILPSAEFYDYNAKYLDGGASKLCIPAQISEEMTERIRDFAKKAYMAIDGEGFARVDFFIDKDTGELYLNEINTIPGFTKFSMFPLLWEAAGSRYTQTIERIIELGYERYNAENNR